MTIDPAVIPGLLLLAAELLALAAVGYVVARVALRQSDHRLALAQGLVIGPALWGLSVNFLLHLFPGMAGALAGWLLVFALTAGLIWRMPTPLTPRLRTVIALAATGSVLFSDCTGGSPASRYTRHPHSPGSICPHSVWTVAAFLPMGPGSTIHLPLWLRPATRPSGPAYGTQSRAYHRDSRCIHMERLCFGVTHRTDTPHWLDRYSLTRAVASHRGAWTLLIGSRPSRHPSDSSSNRSSRRRNTRVSYKYLLAASVLALA